MNPPLFSLLSRSNSNTQTRSQYSKAGTTATVSRASSKSGRTDRTPVINEGYDFLKQTSRLLDSHKQLLDSKVGRYSDRRALLLNTAPVSNKLTKGRLPPQTFHDSAKELYDEVQDAVSSVKPNRWSWMRRSRKGASISGTLISTYPETLLSRPSAGAAPLATVDPNLTTALRRVNSTASRMPVRHKSDGPIETISRRRSHRHLPPASPVDRVPSGSKNPHTASVRTKDVPSRERINSPTLTRSSSRMGNSRIDYDNRGDSRRPMRKDSRDSDWTYQPTGSRSRSYSSREQPSRHTHTRHHRSRSHTYPRHGREDSDEDNQSHHRDRYRHKSHRDQRSPSPSRRELRHTDKHRRKDSVPASAPRQGEESRSYSSPRNRYNGSQPPSPQKSKPSPSRRDHRREPDHRDARRGHLETIASKSSSSSGRRRDSLPPSRPASGPGAAAKRSRRAYSMAGSATSVLTGPTYVPYPHDSKRISAAVPRPPESKIKFDDDEPLREIELSSGKRRLTRRADMGRTRLSFSRGMGRLSLFKGKSRFVENI